MAVEMGARERVRAIGRAVRDEAAALAVDWAARDAAALEAPSACAGWAVRDVAAHLTQGAERAVIVVQSALAGNEPPPLSPENRVARMREIREYSGPELAASFQRDVGAVFDLLEGADETALERVVQVPAGPHTLLNFGTQRLSEATLHGWDIRKPSDPEATLRPESAALFVDYLLGRMPRMAHTDEAPDAAGTYRLDLQGPGGGPVTLTVDPDGASATRGAPAQADVALALPVETFIRLAWGRLDLASAIERGNVRVEGDRQRALRLQELFPGH